MLNWLSSVIRRLQPAPAFTRWEDYFNGHEVLLWDARPSPVLNWTWGMIGLTLFGLPFLLAGIVFIAFGISEMGQSSLASEAAVGFFVVLFGLPFLGIGLALTLGIWLAALLRPQFIRYALTTKRAYIVTSWWAQNVESYAIKDDNYTAIERGKADNVYFTKLTKRDSDGDLQTTRIGFENISDGAHVYALLQDLQQKAAQ